MQAALAALESVPMDPEARAALRQLTARLQPSARPEGPRPKRPTRSELADRRRKLRNKLNSVESKLGQKLDLNDRLALHIEQIEVELANFRYEHQVRSRKISEMEHLAEELNQEYLTLCVLGGESDEEDRDDDDEAEEENITGDEAGDRVDAGRVAGQTPRQQQQPRSRRSPTPASGPSGATAPRRAEAAEGAMPAAPGGTPAQPPPAAAGCLEDARAVRPRSRRSRRREPEERSDGRSRSDRGNSASDSHRAGFSDDDDREAERAEKLRLRQINRLQMEAFMRNNADSIVSAQGPLVDPSALGMG